MTHPRTPSQLRNFWFSDAVRPYWFKASDKIDRRITKEFGATYQAARDGALDGWLARPDDALALVIALDQFPRNMFRGSARSFESNDRALAAARLSVERGFDAAVSDEARPFFYLPFMHSENLADQDRSVALYEALGAEANLRAAYSHRDIIARFGRFPHRNAALNRPNTPDETEFLKTHPRF